MDAIVGFIGNFFGFGAAENNQENAAESLNSTTTPSPKRKTSPASKAKSSSPQTAKQPRSRSSSKGSVKTADSPVVPKRLKLEEEPKGGKTPVARKSAAVRSSAKKTTPSKPTATKGARGASKVSANASVSKSPKPKATSTPKTKTSPKPMTPKPQAAKTTSEKSTKKQPTGKTTNWSLNWDAKDTLILAKDGSSDAWYEARPLDVMTRSDDRLAKVSESDKSKIRGIKAPSKRLSHVKAEEGDWVRIHYNGYNDRYDEWIRFCQGGHLCTGDSSACKCERHS